ncbi:hypothetical protein [Duganella sp. Dugasp56]|uniref:hypothetical protein n=1 Tax=Duganella sp. Dugasp56 TaxID=3243046 RepID=UPI0039AFFE14
MGLNLKQLARALAALLLAAASGAGGAADMQAALVVTMPPQQAQRTILQAVRQLAAQREEHRRYRMALPFGAPLFPPDADFAAPSTAASTTAPALAAWLALPAAQRRYDVLITPDVDYYWNAEGRQYSCQFIIHVQARGGAGSQLALLQVRPTEYAGKHFDLLGRTGPGRYMDLRPAAPSAQTEAELRAFLAAALAHPQ